MSAAPATLVELLALAVSRHADRVAVRDAHGRGLTYRQLDALTAQIAHALVHAGVQHGDRVGVCMPKSINSYACLLAAMRVGAAYTPVDYSAPAERNRYIFTHCRTRVVCTDGPRARSLSEDPAFTIPLLAFAGEAADGVGADWHQSHPTHFALPRPLASDDLSYILYTSGSTGRPKGVVHTHASALSFVNWCADVFRPTADDQFSSHAPFHFDLSVLDLYVPVTAGASVVIIGEGLGKEPQQLAAFIAEQRISCWYSVPSILAMMAQYGHMEKHDYSALRLVNFAGEVFPVKHLRLIKQFWPKPVYYNLYGPTETNVCTYYRVPELVPPQRDTPYPIGIACENCESLVVDENMMPVSEGEGLLLIRANGPVMREYWELPGESGRCFHTDAQGTRWYRTGDVVYRDAEGQFVFVGRRDRMVKRRGYRIELGEIEAGLYRNPQVREVAAVAHEAADGVLITAFLSPKAEQKLSIIGLKQYCSQHLPAYMNPDRFTIVPDLPRTSTGKVDYQSLSRSV